MKKIQDRFNRIKLLNPELGDVIIMYYAINNQGFSRRSIRESFLKLVGKSEYEASDKEELIDHLVNSSEKPLL